MSKILDAESSNTNSTAFDYDELKTLSIYGVFNGAKVALFASADSGTTWIPTGDAWYGDAIANIQAQASSTPIKFRLTITGAVTGTSITAVVGAV